MLVHFSLRWFQLHFQILRENLSFAFISSQRKTENPTLQRKVPGVVRIVCAKRKRWVKLQGKSFINSTKGLHKTPTNSLNKRRINIPFYRKESEITEQTPKKISRQMWLQFHIHSHGWRAKFGQNPFYWYGNLFICCNRRDSPAKFLSSNFL